MGDISGTFPVSVRVRTKHTEKNRVGLWGQSAILKVVWDVTRIMTCSNTPSNFTTTQPPVCQRRHHNKPKYLSQETDSSSRIKIDRSTGLHKQIIEVPLNTWCTEENTKTSPKV
ncbi:hypothetical protein MtrunA17_Chr7g0221591 [Medicago truncatula]|uniref:Uncharacterized protein n=1 Tax=Medicago truncatula TaxID=3880 RepID=G7KSY7_MEDTR|nr:hypothetical protein MTR_7g021290 [Medicago truncatula]RHN44640.1 hypothetical protein MtrunA17_Chr7g0221591 [Medicago truncatula]